MGLFTILLTWIVVLIALFAIAPVVLYIVSLIYHFFIKEPRKKRGRGTRYHLQNFKEVHKKTLKIR